MTTKTKGRAGCHQATPNTANFTLNSTLLAASIKVIIVKITLGDLLPLGMANALIGGMRNG